MEQLSRLAELIKDWNYLVLRDGAKSALPEVGLEITHIPFRHQKSLIFARSLLEPIPDLQPKITLEIRQFEQSDVEGVGFMNRPSESNYCAQRMLHGHIGLVALHQGQLVGYAWGCTVINPKLDRVYLKLVSGDVLCMDVYTSPAYRGLGIQTALTSARFRRFGEMGYKKAICIIERNNAPSLAVWQRKFGSQIIGRVDYLRIGPWYRVRHY